MRRYQSSTNSTPFDKVPYNSTSFDLLIAPKPTRTGAIDVLVALLLATGESGTTVSLLG